jgi:hypothetical protein
MATVQATNIGGVIVPGAHWKVKSLGNISAGDVVKVNLVFEDEKLEKYLSRISVQEVTYEREDDEQSSVTLGFMVERFTHFLDQAAEEPDIESMAWLKPMNRTVEAIILFLLDRENCDPKFLSLIGAKRKEESANA